MKLTKFGCIFLVLIASLSSLNSKVLAGLSFLVPAEDLGESRPEDPGEGQSNQVGSIEILRCDAIVKCNELAVKIPRDIETIRVLLERLAVSAREDQQNRLRELELRFTRLQSPDRDMASLSDSNLRYLANDLNLLAFQLQVLETECETQVTQRRPEEVSLITLLLNHISF